MILHDVSFEMHKAEILGIAGISGNGQRELAEAIYGARKLQSGILSANEEDISSTDIAHRIRLGMRMVTEDPIRDNVVPTFSILENMALVGLDPIYRHGDMDWQAMRSQLQTHSEVKTLRSHRRKNCRDTFWRQSAANGVCPCRYLQTAPVNCQLSKPGTGHRHSTRSPPDTVPAEKTGRGVRS